MRWGRYEQYRQKSTAFNTHVYMIGKALIIVIRQDCFLSLIIKIMTISSEYNPNITGTQINYYFVCHRKLWLFCHHIQMEHTSEFVEMGSLLHEHSYIRKRKENTDRRDQDRFL